MVAAIVELSATDVWLLSDGAVVFEVAEGAGERSVEASGASDRKAADWLFSINIDKASSITATAENTLPSLKPETTENLDLYFIKISPSKS
ncbi:MAG: hypothetical protein NWE93_12110 [Candidatus Bathyarchaeota archaeon]|nr:hypothetical protein [Candidatus Bathyarchaeota archaeon]